MKKTFVKPEIQVIQLRLEESVANRICDKCGLYLTLPNEDGTGADIGNNSGPTWNSCGNSNNCQKCECGPEVGSESDF